LCLNRVVSKDKTGIGQNKTILFVNAIGRAILLFFMIPFRGKDTKTHGSAYAGISSENLPDENLMVVNPAQELSPVLK
jgi:hypothetical protein